MKVTMLNCTPEPLKNIAAGVKNMRGEMVHSLNEISDREALEIFEEVCKTDLDGVFEWVNFTFQIEGISRALTHQLVRHRMGFSFSQESMRFTQVKDMQVAVGKSLESNEHAMAMWDSAIETIENMYNGMIEMGVETQDARGILPTNVLTKIGFTCNYRALLSMVGDRLCYQAQGEWSEVVRGMKSAITESPLITKGEGGILANQMVRPCHKDGVCKFKSAYDRVCPIAEERGE